MVSIETNKFQTASAVSNTVALGKQKETNLTAQTNLFDLKSGVALEGDTLETSADYNAMPKITMDDLKKGARFVDKVMDKLEKWANQFSVIWPVVKIIAAVLV